MAEENKIYKCNICGNIVSVLVGKEGELVCCGQQMEMLKEKTKEQEGKEKHVPVVEIKNNNVKVKVGSVPHPMEKEHYIALIQITKDGKVIAGKRLYPGDNPEAEFTLKNTENIKAKELCSVHGLWISG